MVILSLLLACGGGDAPSSEDRAALARRASIELAGRLPSPQELDLAEASQEGLDALVQARLSEPTFGVWLAHAVSPVWRTEVDQIDPLDGDVWGQRSLGQEPLRMIERIANEDLPYTDLVTADWTMANEDVAARWPVDYPADATGWQPSRYTDGRPVAGVLSGNALWWRYPSTAENLNRGRANALSRILLCTEFSARPVHFERTADTTDAAALLAETLSNPACANCHASLDPLASYLFGFWYYNELGRVPYYEPGTERMWQATTGLQPSFFGEPAWSIADLGGQVANDPRFINCAVQTVWEAYMHRDATAADADRLTAHREAFVSGGVTLRALARSILSDPLWLATGDHEDGRRWMSPRQLASVIEATTGFRWVWQDLDQLDNDIAGVRTLAGGADGVGVTALAREPGVTSTLVAQRLTEAAALWAASQPEGTGVFEGVRWAMRPETDRHAMSSVLQGWLWTLHARRVEPEGPEVQTLLQLWGEAMTLERDPSRAWAVVLSFLLRDPDFLSY